MTSASDTLPIPVPAPDPTAVASEPAALAAAARSHRTLRAFAAAFILGTVAAVALAAGAISGYSSSYAGRVLPGVRVGNVDLSGLDQTAAAAALAAAYGGYGDGRVVIRTSAGDAAIGYRDVSRRPDVDAMVAAALAVGRDGTDVQQAVAMVRVAVDGVVLEPRMILDEAALGRAVALALSRIERAPIDATITMGPHGILTTPARPGVGFDVAAAQATALAALRERNAPAEVVVSAPSIEVAPARGDDVVAAARARAERMIGKVVVTSGKKRWAIPAATVRGWITVEDGIEESVRPVVDTSRITPALRAVAKGVRRPSQSATFLVAKSGKVVGVAASADGRRLDVAATASAIAAELARRAGGDVAAPVRAALQAVSPKLTTEEARKSAPLMTLLGSWTTRFPVGDHNFWGANIWLPARFINGTVLRPGQTFEWFAAVGPITPARGFGPGGVINGNHSEPTGAMGGGMCSSSTTLFNAALRAGLQMGARSNHVYYIDRYPLGLDATVWIMNGGRQTVTFTNDMAHSIFIRGLRLGGAGGWGYVRYEIWGIPDGRRVTIGAPLVSNVLRPTTVMVPVTTLPPGVRRQTEWPANGMDVQVTRVVRNAAGRVIHQETYFSHYRLWNARIEVGVART
jgi:vancomycin resistance protein YoaR